MAVSRRDFLKISGSSVVLGSLGVNLDPAKAYAQGLRIKDAKQTYTVCPFCSVGCGIIVHTKDGKVVNTEGDPDHPINEGTRKGIPPTRVTLSLARSYRFTASNALPRVIK